VHGFLFFAQHSAASGAKRPVRREIVGHLRLDKPKLGGDNRRPAGQRLIMPEWHSGAITGVRMLVLKDELRQLSVRPKAVQWN
jgi:hypothetical protein